MMKIEYFNGKNVLFLCLFCIMWLLSSCSLEKNAQLGYTLHWERPESNHAINGTKSPYSKDVLIIPEKGYGLSGSGDVVKNVEAMVEKLPLESIGRYGMSTPGIGTYDPTIPSEFSNTRYEQISPNVLAKSNNGERQDDTEPFDEETLILAGICFFLGMFGGHFFYTDKYAQGKTRLIYTIVALGTIYGGQFFSVLVPGFGSLMLLGGYLFYLFIFGMNIMDLMKILKGNF